MPKVPSTKAPDLESRKSSSTRKRKGTLPQGIEEQQLVGYDSPRLLDTFDISPHEVAAPAIIPAEPNGFIESGFALGGPEIDHLYGMTAAAMHHHITGQA